MAKFIVHFKVMKKTIGLFIFCALFASFTKVLAQKDTLHLYYMGSQTTVADSNDAKLTKWAKSLKGKHAYVEIYTYYDNSDFKAGMTERCENLYLVVNRKARDLITIKKSGALKGKKHQRYVADIVYEKEFVSSLEQSAGNTEAATTPRVTATETKTTSGTNTGATNNQSTNTNNGNTAVAPVVIEHKPGEIYYDTTYVNGKVKVTKRKAK
jgi:hypothetical protein